MNRFRTAATVLAIAASGLVVATAGPASAAEPNQGGSNCHGVYLSYLSTSGMSPGQLHQDYDATVKDVQATADALCQL